MNNLFNLIIIFKVINQEENHNSKNSDKALKINN